MQFNHILVPTDFAEPAAHALDAAISIAQKFGSQITVLNVSWLSTESPAMYAAEGLSESILGLKGSAAILLSSTLEHARERHGAIEGLLEIGEPWRMILEVAKQRHADLIVMGTHGRQGLSRAVLGSVAERVVRESPVPVLTVSSKACGT